MPAKKTKASHDRIRIQMMNEFVIYINERRAEHMANKSKKGLALIGFLIANRNVSVTNQRLMYTFWADERVTNPENALKTLVSRVRAMLNQISPGLGSCIVADRGAYRWQCMPDMTVDLYELEDAFKALETAGDSAEKRRLYQKVIQLYHGALLKNCEQNEWAFPRATTLHNQYIGCVYAYIEMLKQTGKKDDAHEIVGVCRRALECEPFDDRIHIELMRALIKTNCTTQAKIQFDEVMHLHYHYLGVKPSQEIMDFYDQIVEASKSIDNNLEAICRELYQSSAERGAFVCDFSVFKEIFNLQIRNIERLHSTMFLAVIMISKMSGEPLDGLKQDGVMRDLVNILRMNLRRGDVITHFSPTMLAILLPTVDYSSGDGVMERIKKIFYQEYPNSNVLFNYRIAPLTAQTNQVIRRGKTQAEDMPQIQKDLKEET